MDYGFELEYTSDLGPGASFMLCLMAIYGIVVMWKIFEKAGKPGWAAIVPFYNGIVLMQITGFSPWLLLLAIIPFFGWFALGVIGIIAYFRLAKYFGKSTSFGVGLLFLNLIFLSILAFDDSTYNKVD